MYAFKWKTISFDKFDQLYWFKQINQTFIYKKLSSNPKPWNIQEMNRKKTLQLNFMNFHSIFQPPWPDPNKLSVKLCSTSRFTVLPFSNQLIKSWSNYLTFHLDKEKGKSVETKIKIIAPKFMRIKCLTKVHKSCQKLFLFINPLTFHFIFRNNKFPWSKWMKLLVAINWD